jgi:uncharacterized protein YbaP (TraB family)
MTYKSSLSSEENVKLKQLKLELINTQCEQSRLTKLHEIEQLLSKAKQRYKFLTSLDDEQKLGSRVSKNEDGPFSRLP